MLVTGPAIAADDDCPRLERVVIDETRLLSAAERDAIAFATVGRCIEPRLLRELLTRLSNAYLERGYVTTRPYLPEQDITDGVVEIGVIVGTIEAVVDAATGAPDRRLAAAFAGVGEILNLRRLETALETLERVASLGASFEIRPGRQPGASIVAVELIETKPWRLELGVNGQTDLDDRLSLLFAADNLLDVNDTLLVQANTGEVRETLQSNRSSEIGYSFGVGAYEISLTHAEVDFEQRVQGIDDSFLSSGDTETDTLRVGRLLARGQRHRLGVSLALELRDTRNFFAGQLIDVSSYRTSQLQLEFAHDWWLARGRWSTRYRFYKGLDRYGARDDDYFTLDQGFDNPARLQFEKFVLDSHAEIALGTPTLRLQAVLQYSDDILFVADQLSLGSPYTVRGYSSALSGSNAGYLRGDLIWPLRGASRDAVQAPARKSLQVSLGLDYGEVKCEAGNDDVCGDIYGAGAGIVWSDANFIGQLHWGHPLKELDDGVGDKDQFLLDLRWRF